jgi:4-hydroxybenzoate polyprenyltransferase
MEIVKKRRPLAIARGLVQLCHPLPVLFHAIAVSIFLLLAAWPHFNWLLILLAIAAHTAMQCSIAVLNDYCDRHLDAAGKKNKPLVQGLVRPGEALTFGIGLMLLMLLLLLPINMPALLISLLYLAFGQAYNLGLKSTPFSGIVFALAIPLIPIYAFVAMGHFLPLLYWLVPIAALLGVVLNLANSLPDLEEDAANHARTLAVFLGLRGTFWTCPLLLALGGCLMALLWYTGLVPALPGLLLSILLVGGLLILALSLYSGPGKPRVTRKGYFYLVVLICLLLGGGWIVAALLA